MPDFVIFFVAQVVVGGDHDIEHIVFVNHIYVPGLLLEWLRLVGLVRVWLGLIRRWGILLVRGRLFRF